MWTIGLVLGIFNLPQADGVQQWPALLQGQVRKDLFRSLGKNTTYCWWARQGFFLPNVSGVSSGLLYRGARCTRSCSAARWASTPFMPCEHDRTFSFCISLECMGFSSSLARGDRCTRSCSAARWTRLRSNSARELPRCGCPFVLLSSLRPHHKQAKITERAWERTTSGARSKRLEQSPKSAQCLIGIKRVICHLQL